MIFSSPLLLPSFSLIFTRKLWGKVRVEQLAALSPYQTRHIKRFGDYELDLSAIAPPVMDDLTFEIGPPPIETVEANVPALPAPSGA